MASSRQIRQETGKIEVAQPIPGESSDKDASNERIGSSLTQPGRFFFKGLSILSVIAFLFSPIFNSTVRGKVEVEISEDYLQLVRAPRRSILEEFYVEPGDNVVINQDLVRFSSPQLEREIDALKTDISQAKELLSEIKMERLQAKASLLELTALAEAGETRSTRLGNRATQVNQGILIPEIQELTEEKETLELQLEYDEYYFYVYENLYEEGAISRELRDAKELNYQNSQQRLEIVDERIAAFKQRLEDDAVDERGNANYLNASVDATELIVNTTERIDAQEEVIRIQTERLNILEEDERKLVVSAQKKGQILDHDLNLKLGQEVTPIDVIARVADLNKLTISMQVSVEDVRHLVPKAQGVFRPASAKFTSYPVRVEDIVPQVEGDDTNQQDFVIVRLSLINRNSEESFVLLPGITGYARIDSTLGKSSLVVLAFRQVKKMFPTRIHPF
jgi:hypothetical protein